MFGVWGFPGGIGLTYRSGGPNVRMYLKDSETSYKLFMLKNREISFDVDPTHINCGVNGAFYLVSMDSTGSGNAGAKYGTGDCDASCRTDVDFLQGTANLGYARSCCNEFDLWEANAHAKRMAAHPCSQQGLHSCSGSGCDSCDASGCEYNEHKLGSPYFYGQGGELDTQKPFTVVTQFKTDNGLDTGTLVEVKQFYVQEGRAIANPVSSIGGSITDQYCAANGNGDFIAKGSLAAISAALDRGMVLAISIWDDPSTTIQWLDSGDQGPCPAMSQADVVSTNQDAKVMYANTRYGEITSTDVPFSQSLWEEISVGVSVQSTLVVGLSVGAVLFGVVSVIARRGRVAASSQAEEELILCSDTASTI